MTVKELETVRYEPRGQIMSDPPDPDADRFEGQLILDDQVRRAHEEKRSLPVEFLQEGIVYRGTAKVIAIDEAEGKAKVAGKEPVAVRRAEP